MTEREDNVYRAKLAEQAERYDGKTHGGSIFGEMFPRWRLGGRPNPMFLVDSGGAAGSAGASYPVMADGRGRPFTSGEVTQAREWR